MTEATAQALPQTTAELAPPAAIHPPKDPPSVSAGAAALALIPRDLDQLQRVANMMASSGMMPKGMDKMPTVATAIMMGLEVGLSPMAAVQNIAVINGRPSVWGDAALGIVLASAACEDVVEDFEYDADKNITAAFCTAKRKGRAEVMRRFSIDDAKKAGLWGKAGPWTQYPARMLQMRARSWALRDQFADIMRGLNVREEVQDYIDVTPIKAETEPPKATPGKSKADAMAERIASRETPPPPAETPKAAEPEDKPAMITKGQMRALRAKMKAANWTDEGLHNHLKNQYNLDSSKDLTKNQADEVIDLLYKVIASASEEESAPPKDDVPHPADNAGPSDFNPEA